MSQLFLTLKDQHENETVYSVMAEIQKTGTENRYIVCFKVNHNEEPLFLKVKYLDEEKVYQEIESDEEYYNIKQQYIDFLENQ